MWSEGVYFLFQNSPVFPICSELPGVGVKIAKKIQEILDTGLLSRAENDRNDPLISAMNLIAQIHGVGPKTARKLVYNEGVRTIDEMRARTDLTHQQQLGLKYFDAFQQKIPRDEMTVWLGIVQKIGAEIDPDLIVSVCGSYRRELPTSSDVDVLLFVPPFLPSSLPYHRLTNSMLDRIPSLIW